MLRSVSWTRCALAFALLGGCGQAALSHPMLAQPTFGVVDPLDITGRDFAGMRLPLAVAEGPILLQGSRARVWRELPYADGSGQEWPEVRRVFLSGDVGITLGQYRFEAAQAAVWMRKLPAGDPDASDQTWQVFVYFDRVGSLTGDASIGMTGDRLPVQGVVRADRPVTLQADLVEQGRPADAFVIESERALAAHLRVLAGFERSDPNSRESPGSMMVERPSPGDPIRPGLDRPYSRTGSDPIITEFEDIVDGLPVTDPSAPIFARSGTLSVSSGDISLVSGPDENSLLISDGVVVQYWDRERDRTLELSAERGVIFLEPGPLSGMSRFEIGDVRGVYLEGAVLATDGQYTLRGPRVYYDVQGNRAVVVDAVFWAYDARRSMPLYMRAETIRQESSQRFVAERATLANSRFFTPHFNVGASDITVTRYEKRSEDRVLVDADHITLRAGKVPFFYWPGYKGDPQDVPLRSLGLELGDERGPGILTTWNALSLLGIENTDGLDVDLIVDAYLERGVALGTATDWYDDDYRGQLFGYLLPNDDGTDLMTTGSEIERDGEVRGIVLADHRQRLTDELTLFLEGSYISDEAFVDAFFEDFGESRREITNRALLRWLGQQQAFSAQVKGSFNDFLANEYLLQSQGYSVEKLPELSYHRVADDLLSGIAPGLLTYDAEASFSQMRMSFHEPTAAEIGLTSRGRAMRALGILPSGTVADRLEASGFRENDVVRFDTRQEIATSFDLGPLRVRPYTVGRVTAYDTDFSGFSPDEQENVRLWGAFGADVNTSIVKIDNSVESEFFDLHRIRHIIEPGFGVWTAGTNIDKVDLPVYDDAVESINDGTMIRFSLDQTWQTQRGGPGRWRSVDVLTFDNQIVLFGDDSDRESPIPRYFDYRPELSNPGEFWQSSLVWLTTDALAVSGEIVYDFETSQPARMSTGLVLRQSPELSSYIEVRALNAQDSTYIDFGSDFRVGRKYEFGYDFNYNTEENDFQRIGLEVKRDFPNMQVGFSFSYNRITSSSSLGLILQPRGLEQSGLRLQGLGGTNRQSGSFGR